MSTILLNLRLKLKELTVGESGQDLVEYALIVALVAFGSTAALKALGIGLSYAFSQISSALASAT